MATFRRVQF